MDFVIHRSPGTNPLWIPIDDRIRKLVPPISNQLLEKMFFFPRAVQG